MTTEKKAPKPFQVKPIQHRSTIAKNVERNRNENNSQFVNDGQWMFGADA